MVKTNKMAESTQSQQIPAESKIAIPKDVISALRDLCSIRMYQPKDIPNDVLLGILDAARWAPSPLDTQPWEFVIIRDKGTLKKLREIGHFAGFLEKAPVAIAVVVKPIFEKWSMGLDEHEHAASIAVENIRLAAWQEGIGSCWVSVEHEKAGEILGVPEADTVIAVVSMGYPAGAIKHTRGRLELKDMVSYERYGNKKD